MSRFHRVADFDGDSELGKTDLENVLNYLAIQETSQLSGEERETIVDKVSGTRGSSLANGEWPMPIKPTPSG